MKQFSANTHYPLASKYRCLNDIVLASMPIKEGIDRGSLSRFGDDQWEIGPAIFGIQGQRGLNLLDFSGIICPVERLICKEYIYTSLNVRLGNRIARLHPNSAQSALSMLQHFILFIRKRHGQFNISVVNQEAIDAYRLSLLAEMPAGSMNGPRYLKPIVSLRRLGPYLTCGGLNFLPWGGRTLNRVFGCNPRIYENRTPRIPEQVVGILLHWSLKYIDLFSHDIFAARDELTALEHRRSVRSRCRKKDIFERIEAWIEARQKAGRGIPVWNDPAAVSGSARKWSLAAGLGGEIINLKLISLQTDINPQTIHENARAHELIRRSVGVLGVERGGMDTPISIDPDTSLPWRNRFDPQNLLREEINLQTAAYILCIYLTGMRDGEIQAMRTGAVRCSRSPDGLIERLAIRSIVYKGRQARGEAAEWITIAPVDRAVAVAERLAAHHRRQHEGDELWFVLRVNKSMSGRGIPNIVQWINRFRTTIDERYGTKDQPVFPLVEGRPWVFNTRQFRRTLAWYIANRPFGVVAGKIQYKHASVAMFDGYAGSSASGFRQEVEQERALGQLDDIVEHYEAHLRAERKAGPAVARLAAEYDRLQSELGAFPGQIVDKGKIKAMLAHLGRTLHVGHLTDCFFEPATAMCLRTKGVKQKSGPILSQCAPDRCPNSCISMRHLPAWETSIAEADMLLKDKRLSRHQREALQRESDRKLKLIEPLKRGDTG